MIESTVVTDTAAERATEAPAAEEQAVKDTSVIADQARRVLAARSEAEEAKAAMDSARAAFDRATESIARRVETTKARVADAEARLRSLAIAEFNTTKNKRPGPGVEIKETTFINYNQAKALAWAQTSKMALVLDVKAFEKIALASPASFDFVMVSKQPKATIATDLAKALGATQEG